MQSKKFFETATSLDCHKKQAESAQSYPIIYHKYTAGTKPQFHIMRLVFVVDDLDTKRLEWLL